MLASRAGDIAELGDGKSVGTFCKQRSCRVRSVVDGLRMKVDAVAFDHARAANQ